MGRTLTKPAFTAIKASAGSGKTYCLTTEYIRLLSDGADPGAILCTTFTRKAAGEILERLLQRLVKAAVGDADKTALAEELQRPFSSNDASRLLRLFCQNLHRVAISTNDGFFNRLARCSSQTTAGAFSGAVYGIDDPEVAALLRRALTRMLTFDGGARAIVEGLTPGRGPRGLLRNLDEDVKAMYEVYRTAPQQEKWRHTFDVAPDKETIADALAQLERFSQSHPETSFRNVIAKDLDLFRYCDPTVLKSGIAAVLANKRNTYRSRIIDQDLIDAYQPLLNQIAAGELRKIAERTIALHGALSRFDH
ncbi:MAG TPA: UvrD-helicase domain-containing protein, partial [Chthonomonadales bacterium]|nr:UvrD-helicase domain-containing protein [Chthonomonadales bacterium]